MSLPEWTEAPAVLARLNFWIPGGKRIVFTPDEHDHDYWRATDRPARHWSELTDVTPLYPKEDR